MRGSSLEVTARELADRVVSAAHVTVAAVSLWDPPDLSLTIQGVSALREVSGQRPVGSRVPLASAHCYERVFLGREPVILHGESADGATSMEEAALALAPNLQSVYLVPITFAGELVGILALGEMRAPARDPIDEHKQRRCREVLEEFMATSASVWEARRLLGKLRAATSLLRIAPRVIGARSYGEVLATLASEFAQWLGTPARGVLYRLDQRDGARVVGRWPEPDGFTSEDEGQILVAVARRSGEGNWPLRPVDVVDDPLDPLQPSVEAGTPLMRLDLPLQWNDELLGVACFYFREALYPTTWELEHLEHWGQIGALGMRLVSVADARGVEEQWLRQAACNFLTTHQPTVLAEVLTAVTSTVTERLETSLGWSTGSAPGSHDESRRNLLDAATREVATALTGLREALAGGRDEETTPVDVNDLARRAAEISGVGYETTRRGGSVRLRLTLSRAREPLIALASPGLLAVLVQVIDGAARLMSDGGELEVRTEHDGDHVLVSVRDLESSTMLTVARETLIQALSHERTAGMALSLATAQAFAEKHGGVATCMLGNTRGTELNLRLRAPTGPNKPPARRSVATTP